MTYDENLNPVSEVSEEIKEAWDKAIDLDYLRRHSPEKYPKWGNLERLDSKMLPYGDDNLYVDTTTGIYYHEYMSIGD